MAERVLQLTATIPAGATKAAPEVVSFEIDNWEIERIDLRVPPGPGGAMGFYLANNGIAWIPRTPGEYLIMDDEQLTVTPTDYPTASGWEVVGYNEGTFEHAVIVRFHVNPVDAAQTTALQLPAITFVEHGVPAREVVL